MLRESLSTINCRQHAELLKIINQRSEATRLDAHINGTNNYYENCKDITNDSGNDNRYSFCSLSQTKYSAECVFVKHFWIAAQQLTTELLMFYMLDVNTESCYF